MSYLCYVHELYDERYVAVQSQYSGKGVLQGSFKTGHSNLVYFPSSFLSVRFVNVQVVYPYSRIDIAMLGKKSHFTLSEISEQKW